VGITYERVVEESAIHRERTGQKKERESFFQLLKLWKIFHTRFGSVVVHFGEPLSLRDFFNRPELGQRSWAEQTEDIAYEMARRIEESSALTATSLAAAVLLSLEGDCVRADQCTKALRALLLGAALSHCETPEQMPKPEARLSELLSPNRGKVSEGLREMLDTDDGEAAHRLMLHLERAGLCSRGIEAGEPVVRLTLEQQMRLSYYKNNVMHLFLPAAVLGAAATSETSYPTTVLYRVQQMCKPGFLCLYGKLACRTNPLRVAQCSSRVDYRNWKFVASDDGVHSALDFSEAGKALFEVCGGLLVPYFRGRSRDNPFYPQRGTNGKCEPGEH
jgi:glycerol-3-phosphate O-acyltransferase